MTHRKSLLFAAIFSVVGVVALGNGVYAHETDETHVHDVTAAEAKQQAIEERKAALKQKLEAAKEQRMNKLESQRLATCEKRQAKINSILAKGTEQSEKHLAVFQKIEERVKQFYIDKQRSAEGYDAAVLNADEKEAAAIAAIETSTETTFDCSTADGAKPGDAIRELMKDRHEALKAYRTAIKDLILVVKQADKPAQSTESTEE